MIINSIKNLFSKSRKNDLLIAKRNNAYIQKINRATKADEVIFIFLCVKFNLFWSYVTIICTICEFSDQGNRNQRFQLLQNIHHHIMNIYCDQLYYKLFSQDTEKDDAQDIPNVYL